ncbi:MAG: outer membrane protein [Xanthobacteraceae bacterium]
MFNRLAAAGVVVMLVAGSAAHAADMRVPLATKAPPALAPIVNWSGWYVGGHAGYRWTSTDSDTFSVVTGSLLNSSSGDVNGPAVGGRAGYNYTINSTWMVGLAADVSRTWLSESALISNATGTNVHTVSAKSDWSWAVLGRAGYTTGNWLLYVTGGWEWSPAKTTRNQMVGTVGLATPGTFESVSFTRDGWTLGAGAEVAINRNWSAYAEYRYTDYSTIRVAFPATLQASNTDSFANTLQAGLNYRF